MTLMVDNIVKTFGENESETQVLKESILKFRMENSLS